MTSLTGRQTFAAWAPAAAAGLVGLAIVPPLAEVFGADRTLLNYCVSPLVPAAVIGITLWRLGRQGQQPIVRDEPQSSSLWWLAVIALGVIAATPAANWTIDRLWDLAPGPEWVLGNPTSYRGDFPLDVTPALIAFQLLIRIPLTVASEELLFRGHLQPRLGRNGVVIGSLLFAAYHTGQWWTIVQLVPFGFALGITRWKTGSVWPGIALHYAGNAVYLLNAL